MPIDDAVRFLESIYGPFNASAGVPEADVRAAERRLGICLPAALATLYRRTGAAAAVHAAHNTLVPLAKLGFADDRLVFYEENQGVVAWGVPRARMSDEDPPVEQGQPGGGEGEWTFYPEFASVSDFARAQGAWNAVQGGLACVGVWAQPDSPTRIDSGAITSQLGPAEFMTDGMRAWLVVGGVLVDAGGGYIGLATRAAEQFEAASARLGIVIDSWDYATIRDE
ncbi:MAG: hypothetical protein ACHREM_23155 [Polyangiales bacterium]